MNNKITIRYGAAHHSVSVGDVTIDFCKAHRDVRYQTRKTVIEGLRELGYFGEQGKRRKVTRFKGKKGHGTLVRHG
ncbi:hypothetical protein [Ochrobactrum sp. BTU1]|uniref:hypothetical protein n=1 Tax=Ochrobactrum sp. BTU1 TaxID=2840456 RepID=UPI001C03B810|nr:hypothetical protein KMS41_04985 [Ochrobactrum sp. BTU1]